MKGRHTSEHKQSKFVIACSIILPVIGLICEMVTEYNILDGNGTLAMMVGLMSSAIASAGYSSSRAAVKAAEAQASAIKKKPVVILSEKRSADSTVEPAAPET